MGQKQSSQNDGTQQLSMLQLSEQQQQHTFLQIPITSPSIKIPAAATHIFVQEKIEFNQPLSAVFANKQLDGEPTILPDYRIAIQLIQNDNDPNHTLITAEALGLFDERAWGLPKNKSPIYPLPRAITSGYVTMTPIKITADGGPPQPDPSDSKQCTYILYHVSENETMPAIQPQRLDLIFTEFIPQLLHALAHIHNKQYSLNTLSLDTTAQCSVQLTPADPAFTYYVVTDFKNATNFSSQSEYDRKISPTATTWPLSSNLIVCGMDAQWGISSVRSDLAMLLHFAFKLANIKLPWEINPDDHRKSSFYSTTSDGLTKDHAKSNALRFMDTCEWPVDRFVPPEVNRAIYEYLIHILQLDLFSTNDKNSSEYHQQHPEYQSHLYSSLKSILTLKK